MTWQPQPHPAGGEPFDVALEAVEAVRLFLDQDLDRGVIAVAAGFANVLPGHAVAVPRARQGRASPVPRVFRTGEDVRRSERGPRRLGAGLMAFPGAVVLP